MTPERWRQITGIFHAALARDAAERQAFVARRCEGDEALRRDVDSMLAAHLGAGGFGETPAFATERAFDAVTSLSQLALSGTRLGPYEIGPLLGVGGMGAVYRATDPRLHREVALKVLLPAIADDPDRLERFSREARMLASLNHPNIAQVHDLEESNGVRAIVMELVDGLTLADRIARGPMPIRDAVQIAKQIAEALEAAHDQNIIHRDLKPANVKLRPDGTVKVLDFGLSKALDDRLEHVAQTPTTTTPDMTSAGVVMGTAAYMPPEQAKGMAVDRRADMWAFGCVLFEMVTGRRAFPGDALSEVLVEVIEHEPDWGRLPAKTPPSIRKLLERCLEKDPRWRLDSAAVARLEIDDALKTAAATLPLKGADAAARRDRLWRGLPWVAVVVVAAAAAGIGFLWGRDEPNPPQPAPRLGNAMQVTFSLDVESYPSWSPDGVRVAYQASQGSFYSVANHDIWVAQLGTGEPVNITNHPGDDNMPSWSPDGRQIAFFSDRAGDWGVYTVAAIGGSPRQLLSLPEMETSVRSWSAPQWSKDGTRLLVSARQAGENVVIVLSLASLETTRVVLPAHEGNVCFDLSVSPDGRRFAYVEGGSAGTEVTRLWTVSASGSGAVPLTDGRTSVWSPTWSTDGRSVFYVSNRGTSMDLWHQAVAPDGTAIGEPVPITQGLGIRSAAFSPDGARVAYTRGQRVSNVWRVPILSDRPATWTDAVQLTSERAFIEFVDVSPDGGQLAVSSDRRGNQDLWLLPAGGGDMTPLTADPTPDWAPRWSPGGDEIAFFSYRSGSRDVWVVPARGGPARQLTTHPAQDRNPRWSPDGKQILLHSSRADGRGWWVLDGKGGEGRFLMTSGDSGDDGGDWSPDGQSVVLSRGGRLYRIPEGGGESVLLPPTFERPFSPRFSPDGQSIYFSTITGPPENHDLWKLSLADGRTSRLTQLEGRRGRLGYFFAADARYLYLTWYEDDGDIWVMDVATDEVR